jgi:hypothetical protein
MDIVIGFFVCVTIYGIYDRYATHKERMSGITKVGDGYLFNTTYKSTEATEQGQVK